MGLVQHAQAPIAPGTDRCVRLRDGGAVERKEGFGLESLDATFLIDAQLECDGVHPLIRIREGGQAFSVSLERRQRIVTAEFGLDINGERYTSRLRLSGTSGKRLAIRVDAAALSARVNELQPWGPGVAEQAKLERDGAFDGDTPGVLIGGASTTYAGETFRGRLADFAVYSRQLPDETVLRLANASQSEMGVDIPAFNPGALDAEGRALLLDDYEQLVRWHNEKRLSARELRDASTLAHLWLLDQYPLLRRASDHYGAMLSLPDLVRSRELADQIEASKPVFWWQQPAPAGNWVLPRIFCDDMACWLGQSEQRVTWTAFIKFVRNKLGGGHFDPDDRKRWQQELNELARKTEVGGEPWLAAMMMTLVRSLIFAADGCGLVSLARDEQAAS